MIGIKLYHTYNEFNLDLIYKDFIKKVNINKQSKEIVFSLLQVDF